MIVKVLAALTGMASSSPGAEDPKVYVFLKHECPCNTLCAPELNELGAQLKRNGLEFIGVTDLPKPEIEAYALNAGLAIPILPDPQRSRIRAAKATFSLEMGIFDPKGRQIRHFNGYNRQIVRNLANALSGIVGRSVKLDAEKFPVDGRIGCAFDPFRG